MLESKGRNNVQDINQCRRRSTTVRKMDLLYAYLGIASRSRTASQRNQPALELHREKLRQEKTVPPNRTGLQRGIPNLTLQAYVGRLHAQVYLGMLSLQRVLARADQGRGRLSGLRKAERSASAKPCKSFGTCRALPRP